MTKPTFLGIAIPAYKRVDLLGRLLDSIKTNFPIVVSDNGGHLPADFKGRYAHVQFLTGPEVPVLQNWNRAARGLNTEWIIMPGDDDLYYPKSFTEIEEVLRQRPSSDIVFFGHKIIDENDNVRETWRPVTGVYSAPKGFNFVRMGVPARPPSIVFRSELYRELGGFSEKFKVTAGDNHFYQRACLIGEMQFSDKVVSGYRVWNAGSTSQTVATRAWMQEIDLWCAEIQAFAKAQTSFTYPVTLRDEVYLANLRSGIGALKERGGYLSAWRHVMNNRYPFKASLPSQAKLLAHLLIPLIRR